VEGASAVDESMVTGESMPVEKRPLADKVTGGTLNTSGSFIMERSAFGRETMLAQIVRLVQRSPAQPARRCSASPIASRDRYFCSA